jgi:hypothetical protein
VRRNARFGASSGSRTLFLHVMATAAISNSVRSLQLMRSRQCFHGMKMVQQPDRDISLASRCRLTAVIG